MVSSFPSVGPVTNIASFVLLKQKLDLKVTAMHLFGLSTFGLIMGLLQEWLLRGQQWLVLANLGNMPTMLPGSLSWLSAYSLLFFAIKPLSRIVVPQLD